VQKQAQICSHTNLYSKLTWGILCAVSCQFYSSCRYVQTKKTLTTSIGEWYTTYELTANGFGRFGIVREDQLGATKGLVGEQGVGGGHFGSTWNDDTVAKAFSVSLSGCSVIAALGSLKTVVDLF
jgi:hypothetical protein